MGLVLKYHLWKIARASTMQHINEGLEEMKVIDSLAYEWLASKPGNNWSRSHFSEHFKCDLLLNNLYESFNASIKPARCKPILSMLEDIRVYLMTFVMKKKLAMSRNDCELSPKIQEKLEKLKGLQHQYITHFNGDDKFEVVGSHHTYEIDVTLRKCWCRRWQLTVLPCVHAVACATHLHGEPETFVHECYTKQTYMRTYNFYMNPLNGMDMWPKTMGPPILHPLVSGKKKCRSARIRRKTPEEIQANKKKLSRDGTMMKCSKCKNVGHNSRPCGKISKTHYIKKTDRLLSSEEVMPKKNSGTKKRQGDGLRYENVGDEMVRNEGVDVSVHTVGVNDEYDDAFWAEMEERNDLWGLTQSTQASQTTQTSEPIQVRRKSIVEVTQPEPQEVLKKGKQQERKNTRISQSQPKGPIIVSFVDLNEGKEEIATQSSVVNEAPKVVIEAPKAPTQKQLLHGGIMKPFQLPKQLPKCIISRAGTLFVNATGMKAAIDKLNKKK